VPANSEPIITLLAPAASALVTSPECFTPPSAMMGTPCRPRPARTRLTAVICGTPTPATTRVVQMLPGPMPTLTASTPASMSASVPSAVATLPAMTFTFGEFFLRRAHRVDDPAVVTMRRVDDEHVDARRDESSRPLAPIGPGPMAAPTRRRRCSSLTACGYLSA
jgi:hypothetical protein